MQEAELKQEPPVEELMAFSSRENCSDKAWGGNSVALVHLVACSGTSSLFECMCAFEWESHLAGQCFVLAVGKLWLHERIIVEHRHVVLLPQAKYTETQTPT